MICRSIIRTRSSKETDELKLDLSWYSTHPGDQVEQAIISYINSHLTESIKSILQINAKIITIIWFGNSGFGLSVVLNIIEDDLLKINYDAYLWSYYTVWYYSKLPSTWEDLSEIYHQEHEDKVPEEIVSDINRDWFEVSLEGGLLQLKIEDDIHNKIANIFGYLPWSIFFIENGSLEEDRIMLNFNPVNGELNLDIIFSKITGELDEQFWFLLYSFIRDLQHIDPSTRGKELSGYLNALSALFTDDLKVPERIKYLHSHASILSKFDSNFLYSYVQETLTDVTEFPTTISFARQLLDFSEDLIEFKFTELARLVEGTVLEIALKLEKMEYQEEIILQLTSRSQEWGRNHLIAYVESVSGLLVTSAAGKQIIEKVIDKVKSDLVGSWDGLMCLVETNLLIGNITKAILLRYQACFTITDRSARRDDIFNATTWSLQLDVNSNKLFSIAREQLVKAIELSKEEETLINQLDIVTKTAIQNNHRTFLTKLYKLFGEMVDKLPHLHYVIIFDHLTTLVKDKPQFTRAYIELLVAKFIVLAQKSKLDKRPMLTDEYFQLVSTIYNIIDPSKPKAKDVLIYITKQIIFTATDISDWPIVEESSRRFALLFGAENASYILKEIYYEAALRRSNIPGTELKENDIGIRLFNEAVNLSDIVDDRDFLIQIIPKIKQIIIKSRSYGSLPELIKLEIKLKKLLNHPWIDQMFDDIRMLVRKEPIKEINDLFSIALSMDLMNEERYRILENQLELAEQEPDLLTADEIYKKRQHLIALSGVEESDTDFIIQNYRAGVSELITKDDTKNLHKLLFDALSFCIEQDLKAPITEFQTVLLDSFDNLITDYQITQTKEMYISLLSFFRLATTRFSMDLPTIPIGLAFRLINSLLSLYDKASKIEHLRKAQLILRELSLVLPSSIQLTSKQKEDVSNICDRILNALKIIDKDYGMIEGILEISTILNRMNLEKSVLPYLDQIINHFKKQMVNEPDASTGLVLLLYVVAEVHLNLGADLDESLHQALIGRMENIINFAISLNYSKKGKEQLKSLKLQLQNSSQSLFQEIPFSLDQYLEVFILKQF